jgi:hypothetical protein
MLRCAFQYIVLYMYVWLNTRVVSICKVTLPLPCRIKYLSFTCQRHRQRLFCQPITVRMHEVDDSNICNKSILLLALDPFTELLTQPLYT